jgi:hypothetical protein
MDPQLTNPGTPTTRPIGSRFLKLAALALAAALALTLAYSAVYAAPSRGPLSRAHQGGDAANVVSAGPAVDPVVHNIGKYVASHQILWPHLSQPNRRSVTRTGRAQ